MVHVYAMDVCTYLMSKLICNKDDWCQITQSKYFQLYKVFILCFQAYTLERSTIMITGQQRLSYSCPCSDDGDYAFLSRVDVKRMVT